MIQTQLPRTIINKHAFDLSDINLDILEKDIQQADRAFNANLNIKTILEQLSLVCNDKSLIDPQYSLLAGRLQMENIRLEVPSTFGEATENMRPILDEKYADFVRDNRERLEKMLIPENDFTFGVFAVATLRKSYLAHLKINDKSHIMETPQYMYLRVAVFLHFPNFEHIEKTYNSISKGLYSQATPTLFNAGLRKPQLASCFLNSVSDDLQGISKAWHDQAIISMNSGGIGSDYGNLRHSEIGQHGISRGVVPWLKITNEILKTVDQGGKRKGSGTMYLRDWHVDIFEFVELRDEGPEDMRAKDLFLGIMISDLFMKRIEEDGEWSLFCPNKVKGLSNKWGSNFEEDYIEAEKTGLASHKCKARDLWMHILGMQIKKGMPFILFMDHCNRKSNQQHAGMIRCSNLCCEITLNTSPDEIASCTLSSISLNRCVKKDATGAPFFDFPLLERLTAEVVRNLNQVIDRNFYPEDIPQIKFANFKHRPLGIGVQGLADTVALLDLTWVSENPDWNPEDPPEARYVVSKEMKKLNSQIFETIYFSAVRESVNLAKVHGWYESFPGSPASNGRFQFDLWDHENFPINSNKKRKTDFISENMYSKEQWNNLRHDMYTYGLRNSTLIAIMPTASSAHILGNQEACEPFTELIYARTVLSGQFMLVNKHMVRDLKKINMWDDFTIKSIISNRGSITSLSLPETDERSKRLSYLKLKYLTIFELPQKVLLELGADRGRYICQTESRNCFMARPTKTKLNAYHFHAWKLGLKTGMYYLRQKALTDPINFSSDTQIIPSERKSKKVVCTDDICMSCNV
jgi:ribonucleotide reductase alpha subunit